jgi:hypothetical protein
MSEQEKICLFGQTNFRNRPTRFGIKTDDRRRHMYVIGKTGMGKTTLLENMLLHDIYNGHGVGLIDPHGDFAEGIIDFIPSHRINDVVYLNPADLDHPIGFNILETESEEQKHLVAAGLMGVFKKIWPDVWSSRMEYILNNTLLALLDYPGTTLLGINRLLSDKKYRKRVVSATKDPVIRSFWQNEFANYADRYQKEAVAPIQNKIGQFLSATVTRNMVAQVKSTINIREIMDSGKILIMNLSKGRIGEDNSRLLGGMLITKIQLSAMERVDMPEHERKDFFLYVDEFQNFATPSFANILSEARKYRLSLILAHQYIAQLDEVVANAVFGNVGTIVSFRVGGADAEAMLGEFSPTFTAEDIVNLPKYHIFLKLMINGVSSSPFSATTLPPIANKTGSFDKVVKVSRERYAKPRVDIEEKILRWSGMGDDDQGNNGSSPQPKKSDKPKSAPKPTVAQKPSAQSQPAEPKKQESKKQQQPASQSSSRGEQSGEPQKQPPATPAPAAPSAPTQTVAQEKAPPTSGSEQHQSTPGAPAEGEQPPKKKRRRRRRRKKKSSDATPAANQESTAGTASSQTPMETAKEPTSAASSQLSASTHQAPAPAAPSVVSSEPPSMPSVTSPTPMAPQSPSVSHSPQPPMTPAS